jgi:hypothetical protein
MTWRTSLFLGGLLILGSTRPALTSPAESADSCEVNDNAANLAAKLPPAGGPGTWSKCSLSHPAAREGEQSLYIDVKTNNLTNCAHYITLADKSVHRSPVTERPGLSGIHIGCDWVTIGTTVLSNTNADRALRCKKAGNMGLPTTSTLQYGADSGCCVASASTYWLHQND